MVEQLKKRESALDAIFRSLGDATRRDILRRIQKQSKSIGEIAEHYELSFAGVAKHIGVLEEAGLVQKTRRGKEQVVSIAPQALEAANEFLETYRDVWEKRLDKLGEYLKENRK